MLTQKSASPVDHLAIAQHLIMLLDNLNTDAAGNTAYWLYQLSLDKDTPDSWQKVRDYLMDYVDAHLAGKS